MYGLVPYNISPIQQGIQFGHAVVEYGLAFGYGTPYQQWAKQDKTFIILNGGTTNNNMTGTHEYKGTLNKAEDELVGMEIPIATFHEPDLGDQLTAVVFLVDERVYDKEKYPDATLFYEKEVTEETMLLMDNFKNVHGDDWEMIAKMQCFLSKFRLA